MPSDSYYALKPGLHSRNAARHAAQPVSRIKRRVNAAQWLLLLVGLICLGYYAYTVGNERLYQAYENWVFDQQIAGKKNTTFQDYVRERTPFAFLTGSKAEASPAVTASALPGPVSAAPVEGDVIGRVAIPRLNLSAVVRQGVNDSTLNLAVGHIPSTAMPGKTGNFAIAAHRDTLFRGLKDIRNGDIVTFQSPTGTFEYQVMSTKIVRPTDVSVLRPDGGGLLTRNPATPPRILTMITCYPFHYVGSAPKRFIVQAQQLN